MTIELGRKPAVRLSLIPSARLVALIEGEYAKSGLNDPEFAAHATKVLGFDVLPIHVELRRKELGIASSTAAKAAAAPAALEERLARAERDGAALAAEVERLAARLEKVIGLVNLQKHFYEGAQRPLELRQ